MRKQFVDIRTALSCATNLLLAWHLSIEHAGRLAGSMYTACRSGVEAAGMGVDTDKHAAMGMLDVYCLPLRC